MKIKTEKDKGTLTVKAEGRLDAANAGQLEEALEGRLAGMDRLVVDLTRLDYLASAGIRVLLKAYKAMAGQGGVLAIRGANEEVADVLAITGFADKVVMEEG